MKLNIWGNMQGVENVYTQHTPLLVHTLELLSKGRLRDTDYPSISKSSILTSVPGKSPKLVIVFIVGGTTYEEVKAVAELNSQVSQSEIYFAHGIPETVGIALLTRLLCLMFLQLGIGIALRRVPLAFCRHLGEP